MAAEAKPEYRVAPGSETIIRASSSAINFGVRLMSWKSCRNSSNSSVAH